MDSVIAVHLSIGVAIFVICSLTLEDSYRSERERKMIGWIGLSAPVWPLTALVALVIAAIVSVRRMYQATRSDK